MANQGNFVQQAKDLAAEYAYLVTLICVIGVIVGSAVYTQHVREESQAALVQAAAGAPEIEATVSPQPIAQKTPLPTIAPLKIRMSVLGERMIWPVEGTVLRGHEPGELVLWEALDTWQAHTGIDIKGEAEQSVLCAAEGIVTNVSRDALWGASIETQMENGRTFIYRGLALCYVHEGEQIVRGQTIGTLLAGVPCEAELGTHLHLETIRDGKTQDPLAVLPER